MTVDDRPDVEERMLTAANTSDLTVGRWQQRKPLDMVIAAGAVARTARLGIALMNLESEWHAVAKPRKSTAAEIARRAAELPLDRKGRPDVRRAQIEALMLHTRAMKERAEKLTGRSTVMGLLTDWANEHGVDVDLLSPTLFHFLSPQCPVCTGLGEEKMKDAPTLNGKCAHCKGLKTWPRPLGAQSIVDHIKECVGAARGRLSERMRG